MAADHLAVHPHTASPESVSDHPAVQPHMESPEAALKEIASLPKACLLEYCRGDQMTLLYGRVDSILRSERESSETRLNESSETRLNECMETLHVDREAHARDEHSASLGAADEAAQRRLPAMGMGLQRQQSFRPGSMLTERERCAVRARRESCVQHLVAGGAIGKTIRKPGRASCSRTSWSLPL